MTSSVLLGVSEVFDKWLGLQGDTRFGTQSRKPKYKSKTASIELSQHGGPFNIPNRSVETIDAAILEAMERLESNLKEIGIAKAADSNWKWRKSHHLSPRNRSSEKILEKVATFHFGEDWVNQVPTCNGLVPAGASACRIDLAHRVASDHYELIELKFGMDEDNVGSDSPLFASMELMEYALLYIQFRIQLNQLSFQLSKDHHLLCAKRIDLIVLAPHEWYRFKNSGSMKTYEFSWLEEAITQGLQKYLDQRKLDFRMSFRFEALPSEFTDAFRSMTQAFNLFRENEFKSRKSPFAR